MSDAQRFEYRTENIGMHLTGFHVEQFGNEGWRLVAVYPYFGDGGLLQFIWERPVKSKYRIGAGRPRTGTVE